MTPQEAREILAIYRFNLIQSMSNQLEGDIEALDMAIKALEQPSVTDFSDKCKECGKILNDKLQARWIPVSERLPEEHIAVLVWCPERKNIYCACYEEKQWWIFGAYFKKIELDVIAWMPLPEPYKAESEDEE